MLMTYSSRSGELPPFHGSAANAIREPSGDQAGDLGTKYDQLCALKTAGANVVWSSPFGLLKVSPKSPSHLATNAIRLPSGDHVGLEPKRKLSAT